MSIVMEHLEVLLNHWWIITTELEIAELLIPSPAWLRERGPIVKNTLMSAYVINATT